MKSSNVQGIILHHLSPCILVTFSAYLSGIQRVLSIDLSNGPFQEKPLVKMKITGQFWLSPKKHWLIFFNRCFIFSNHCTDIFFLTTG